MTRVNDQKRSAIPGLTMDDSFAPAQKALFDRLDALDIPYEVHRHAPVFTVGEAQAVREDVPGAHTKNLFLKDKKDNFFLVVLEETAEIDLKTIHGAIGAKSRVSFGKPERLAEYLGVRPGSVTALGVVNDTANNVQVVIDAPLLEHEVINAHPLSNDATVSIARDDLLRFIRDCGHEPLVLNLSG